MFTFPTLFVFASIFTAQFQTCSLNIESEALDHSLNVEYFHHLLTTQKKRKLI